MGFHDVEFPRDLSFGTAFGPQHSTGIVEVASGAEQRVQRWTSPRHRYDVAYVLRELNDPAEGLARVLTFHRARSGRANSFRFWDAIDYSTNPLQTPNNDATVNATELDEFIGDGATGVFDYQLVKTYTSGLTTVTRNVTKPIQGTVKVAYGGTLKVENTDYTVNYSTGVVTIASNPGNGVDITAGCKFNVPVRFEDDTLMGVIESYNTGSTAQGIGLVEDLSNVVVQGALPRLGSSYQTFGSNLALTPQMGEFVRLNPTAGSLSLLLPQHTAYADGGPHWVLQNVSANALACTYSGTTLFTLQAAGDATKRDLALLMLGYDSGNVRGWVGIGP